MAKKNIRKKNAVLFTQKLPVDSSIEFSAPLSRPIAEINYSNLAWKCLLACGPQKVLVLSEFFPRHIF